jgi:hypothetical protein
MSPETVDHGWLRAGLASMDGFLAWEAIRHKVGRLVLAQMRHLGVQAAPKVLAGLKAKLMADGSARLLLLRNWPLLVRLLEDNGIPCLTLKGPAASIQLHGNPEEREYVDLDLLVDLPEPGVLAPVMGRAGFLPMDRYCQERVPPSARTFFLPVHHAGFMHRELPVHVEIHGNQGFKHHKEFFPVPAAELFHRAVPLIHEGQSILTLDPVDHALFMIAHGIGHAWGLLHWALDAAAILAPARAAFHPAILDRGRELGMERMIAVSATVVQRTFGASLPEGFDSLSRDPRLVPLPALHHCLARRGCGSRGYQTMAAMLKHSIHYLGAVAGGRGFFLWLLLDLVKLKDADLELIRLPRMLFFVYLPLRPVFVLYRRMARLLAPRLLELR